METIIAHNRPLTLVPSSPEELERFFPEEYSKGADLQETSLEMTRFARQHLKVSKRSMECVPRDADDEDGFLL